MSFVIEWRDQPDYYDTSTLTIQGLWEETLAAAVASGEGDNSQNALKGTADNAFVRKQISGGNDDPAFGIGCKLRVNAYPGSEKIIAGICNFEGELLCSVGLRPDGTLGAYNGGLLSLLVESDVAIDLNTQMAFGFRGLAQDSDGEVEIYINGQVYAHANGADISTVTTSNPSYRGVYYGLNSNIRVSHMYAGIGIGALPHGHLVFVRRSIAPGNLTEWVPNTGTIATAIDDAVPDLATSIIQSPALASRFSNQMTAVPSFRRILGTQAIAIIRNTIDSGFSPSFRHLAVIDGAQVLGNWKSCTADNWRAILETYPFNPRTGGLWTPPDLTALERGGYTES